VIRESLALHPLFSCVPIPATRYPFLIPIPPSNLCYPATRVPFSSNLSFTKFIKPAKILSPFIRQIRVIRVPIFVQSGLYKIYQTPKNFIPFYPPNPRHPRSHFLPISPSLNLSNPQKFYPLLSAKSPSSAFPFFTIHPLLSRYPCPIFFQSLLH